MKVMADVEYEEYLTGGGDVNYKIAEDDFLSMAITDKWGNPYRIGRGPGAKENMNEIVRRITTSKNPEKTALEIIEASEHIVTEDILNRLPKKFDDLKYSLSRLMGKEQ